MNFSTKYVKAHNKFENIFKGLGNKKYIQIIKS